MMMMMTGMAMAMGAIVALWHKQSKQPTNKKQQGEMKIRQSTHKPWKGWQTNRRMAGRIVRDFWLPNSRITSPSGARGQAIGKHIRQILLSLSWL